MRGTGPFARLWVRLLLAFAAVLAVAVLVPAVYARQAARAEFQRYVNTGQQTRRANLAGLLALSYRQNRGSWDGLQDRVAGYSELFCEHVVVTDAYDDLAEFVEEAGQWVGTRVPRELAQRADAVSGAVELHQDVRVRVLARE